MKKGEGMSKVEVLEVGPLTDMERTRADLLTETHTAFSSFDDMVRAHGGYRPSLKVSKHEVKELADFYDREQVYRGDSRRASRFK